MILFEIWENYHGNKYSTKHQRLGGGLAKIISRDYRCFSDVEIILKMSSKSDL